MNKLFALVFLFASISAQANESKKLLVCKGPINLETMFVPIPVSGNASALNPTLDLLFSPSERAAGFGENLSPGYCSFSDRGMASKDGSRVAVKLGNSDWRMFYTTSGGSRVTFDFGIYSTVNGSSAQNKVIVIHVVPNPTQVNGAWMIDPSEPSPIRINP